MKMFRISVECNSFDVNEDKQRQCYKQLKCFWPKCEYSCKQTSHLERHISNHLNKQGLVQDYSQRIEGANIYRQKLSRLKLSRLSPIGIDSLG